MKQKIIIFLTALFFSILGSATSLQALSAQRLKGYMFQFVSLASELRMEDIKGARPNWEAMEKTLKAMRKNLQAMREADSDQQYSAYLDRLSSDIKKLQVMEVKRDPKISKAYDRMTQSCLQCHSAHLSKGTRFEEPIK